MGNDLPADPRPTQPVRPRPRLRPRWVALLLAGLALMTVVVSLSRRQPHTFHGILLQTRQPVADFTLQSSHHGPLSLSELRGQYVLLYFGYTHCPDVCPLTLVDLAQTLDQLGDQANAVQVLFVTVDPARDTAQQLASYLPHFHPDFVGLTGEPTLIDAVATQFGVFHDGGPANDNPAGLIDHTNNVIVLDRRGHVQLLFPPGAGAAEMAADLAYLLR